MKRICLFMIFLFNLLGINAQQVKSYKDDVDREIQIKDDIFYYIEHQPYNPYWYNDTLAVCTIKKINNNFMELNSDNPYQVIYSGYNVTQKVVDYINKDSIEICFQIPYDKGKLDISILSDNTFPIEIYDLHYSAFNNKVLIPNIIKSFSYSISPDEKDAIVHDVWGVNYGILYILLDNILLENNINHIEISIPALTNSFFEKYYVNKDYARIIGDTIIWKGRTFIKQNSIK